MKTLYELSQEYLSVLHDIDNLAEEEKDMDSIIPMLEAMQGEIKDKIINCGKFIKELEHREIGLKNAQDNIKQRIKSLETKINSIKSYVLYVMESSSIKKINGIEFDVSVRESNSVDDFNQELIPDQYFIEKTTRTLDKMKIKEDLKSGIEINGVCLKTNKNLIIK